MKNFYVQLRRKSKDMSDIRCESHDLSLERFVIDENECLQLVNCHECKSNLHQIWTHTRTEKVRLRFSRASKISRLAGVLVSLWLFSYALPDIYTVVWGS